MMTWSSEREKEQDSHNALTGIYNLTIIFTAVRPIPFLLAKIQEIIVIRMRKKKLNIFVSTVNAGYCLNAFMPGLKYSHLSHLNNNQHHDHHHCPVVYKKKKKRAWIDSLKCAFILCC